MHFLLVVGLTVGLAGCGRAGRPAPPENGAAAAQKAEAGKEAELAQVLGELTQRVRKYSVEQRQAPQSLDDLVAKGYLDRVPEAPAGKRFVITRNLQVQLGKL